MASPQVNLSVYPGVMDLEELKLARKRVLLELLHRWEGGEWSHLGAATQDAFAQAIGVKPSTITRWKTYPDGKQSRAIGDTNALRIEGVLDLASGTMMLPELVEAERAQAPSPRSDDHATLPERDGSAATFGKALSIIGDVRAPPSTIAAGVMALGAAMRPLNERKRRMVISMLEGLVSAPEDAAEVAREVQDYLVTTGKQLSA